MTSEDMSNFLSDARELIGQLKNQSEINGQQIQSQNKQIEMYRISLEETKMLMDKRIDLIENQQASFRKWMIIILSVAVFPALIGAVSIKTDMNQLMAKDYAEQYEVERSLGVVIDSQTDSYEEITGNTEEADKDNKKVKDEIKEIFGYKSRSVKND